MVFHLLESDNWIVWNIELAKWKLPFKGQYLFNALSSEHHAFWHTITYQAIFPSEYNGFCDGSKGRAVSCHKKIGISPLLVADIEDFGPVKLKRKLFKIYSFPNGGINIRRDGASSMFMVQLSFIRHLLVPCVRIHFYCMISPEVFCSIKKYFNYLKVLKYVLSN